MEKRLEIRTLPGKGRGVFATAEIKEGEIIECCPVVVLDKEDTHQIDSTILYNYYFSWGDDLKSSAIALGYGSLYNHSYIPNAEYEKDLKNGQIIFKAIKNIQNGEEITVNYNGKPDDWTPIWFTPL